MSFLRRPKIEAKTTEQILLMREAGLVVGRTLELMRGHAVAGVTTGQLDALAEEHIRSLDAVPSFKGYHGFPGSLCVSVNEEVVHGIPGERVLREGDLVSIDCGAIYQGWHGDAAISLIVGGPEAGRPEDVALVEDTEAAMWAGIAALQVGGRLFAVGDAVEGSAEAALERRRAAGQELTYGILEDYVGHGIGTQMHMDPNVPNYSVSSKGPTVPSGATLAIEPMITLGTIETTTLDDDWTVITNDRSRAAHWENTVAVTDAGLWVLTAVDGGAAGVAAAGGASGHEHWQSRAAAG
ncbi:type I methionyl aminopeptidase [Ornithinimicrobium sp. F0845]|uniref:type I methionyl aminopeptidase n=1 Tax=Ornithinimicrobium sp. F0845 TaxID=2926412 RepID=UPI001FF17115|nr:type I methionyl aminopeptidase [Ornithinimicrobium sp. F0845]MCK0110976.1 type I methionyl aminopeptidase [Ornithinimicrobium sp. F0845]